MEESLIDVYYKNFLDNKRKYIYFNSECYNTNYIDKQSDSLLMFLLDKNIKKNERVVVLLPRGIDLLVSIVAVIKAGATYVPVDVNITQDDLDYIIEDSGATYVILSSTESRYVFSENINVIREEHLLFKYDKTCKIGFTYKNLKYNRDINSIAYIIYTSGTSGHPKGVMVGDQNIISTMKACCRRLELDNEKFLIKSNKAFDFSIFELLVIFFSGNSVFILPEGDERDPQKVLDYIIENEITTLTYVPTGFSYFLDYIERNDKSQRCDKVHKILLGGEKVDKSLVLQANSVFPQAEIWNLYGPTEATFCSSMFKIEDPDYITIGTALEGEKLEIRDSNGKTCDILITGEIVILGTGISKGYTKNKLNRNKFVFNSEFSEYKTGDLGYIDNYGNIVIVGRNDDEIKRNGYRISINSLEESIREEFPKLLFKLMFFDKNNYSREICLFYIVQSAISKNDILSKLSQRLPSYMLPNKYISLNSFPLKNSGKIDNNKLKKIFEENFLDVSTITKQLELNMDSLALIWKKVLGISQLNYNDSFFAIGGTSLNVVELTLEIEESLNFIISTSDVYENDTIESQFLFISQKISNQSIQRKITHNNETEICRFNIYDLETKNTDIKLSGEGTFQEITDLMNYKFFQNKKRDVLTFSIPIKCENERFDELFLNLIQKQFVFRTLFYYDQNNHNFYAKLHPVESIQININSLEEYLYADQKLIIGENLERLKKNLEKTSISERMVIFSLFRLKENDFIINLAIDHMVSDFSTSRIIKKYFNSTYIVNESSNIFEYYNLNNNKDINEQRFKLLLNNIEYKRYNNSLKNFFKEYPQYYPAETSIIFSKPIIWEKTITGVPVEQTLIFLENILLKIFDSATVPVRIFSNPRNFGNKNFYDTIGDFSDSILCVAGNNLFNSYVRSTEINRKNSITLKHFIKHIDWSRQNLKKVPVTINYFDYITQSEFEKEITNIKNSNRFKFPIQIYNVSNGSVYIVFQNGLPDWIDIEGENYEYRIN